MGTRRPSTLVKAAAASTHVCFHLKKGALSGILYRTLGGVQGPIHTNNIESAWAVLKRAHHGSHHHYSVKWTPLYLAEAGWKWNERGRVPEQSFDRFLRDCMET